MKVVTKFLGLLFELVFLLVLKIVSNYSANYNYYRQVRYWFKEAREGFFVVIVFVKR